MKKTCSKCATTKGIDEFGYRSRAMEKRKSACKTCEAELAAAWRKANPDQHRAAVRRRYKLHRDRLNAGTREWRQRNAPQIRATKAAWNAANPEKIRAMETRSRARKFGLSIEGLDALFAAQGGRCAICGLHESALKRRLSIDHDHDTGRVRALLCGPCNSAIGLLREDPDILEKAREYLLGHQFLAAVKAAA